MINLIQLRAQEYEIPVPLQNQAGEIMVADHQDEFT